jgi:hypothetical protein
MSVATPGATSANVQKPRLNFWQIWNMSFGFLGIQVGWGMQMGNMSAIYEYLGAKPDEIPLLWLAAPMTGLLVQPIIGYMSDRTWGRWGRRKPYFFRWRYSGHPGAVCHATLVGLMDGRGFALDTGCQHQYQHGTLPRFCGRPASGRTN